MRARIAVARRLLYGRIVTGGRDADVAGFARVWRADLRSIDFELPQRVIDRGDRPLYSYTWRVLTSDERCSFQTSDVITFCYDFAPGTGSHTHVVAECDDGLDNDEDGTTDGADPACFWFGQPSEDRVFAAQEVTISKGRREGVVKARVVIPPVVDDQGRRHPVPFDDCREVLARRDPGDAGRAAAGFGGATPTRQVTLRDDAVRCSASHRFADRRAERENPGESSQKTREWVKQNRTGRDRRSTTSEGGDMSNENIRELFIEELEEVRGGGADSSVGAIDTTQACCEEIYNPRQCCL